MRPPLHTHSILAGVLDADLLDCLSQIIVRAHLRVQEHLAYRRGERGTRMWSAPGSGGRAQSARAWSRPLCAFAVLGASLSGAQVAYACTLSLRMCEWSRAPGWIT